MTKVYKVIKVKWQNESVCFSQIHCENFCWGSVADGTGCTQVRLQLIQPEFVYKYKDQEKEYLTNFEKTFCSHVCLDHYLDSLIDKRVTAFMWYPGLLWLIGLMIIFWYFLFKSPLVIITYVLFGLISIAILGGGLTVILDSTISIKNEVE